MKNLNLLILLVSIIIILGGCKKDPPPVDDDPITGENIIFEITKVIDEDTRNIISEIDTSNFTFTFNGESNLSKNFVVGDIIVDSTSELAPYGYLRKITSISEEKGGIVVNTEQAALTDALEHGNIDFNSGAMMHSQLKHVKLADGVTFKEAKDPNFTVFELDYDKAFENENGSVTMMGHSELSMDFFFGCQWDWQIFPYPSLFVDHFETGVEVDQASSISFVSEGGASVDERFNLATFYFSPWTFMAGPVPVVLSPRVQVFMEVNGEITAVFTASASEDFTGRLGVEYDGDDWDKIAEKTFNHDYTAPDMTLEAQIRGDVGPEMAFLLYGIAGPFVDVSAFGDLTSTLHVNTGNWDLNFDVGARTRVGVTGDLIGIGSCPGFEFELFRYNLLNLEDEPFNDDIFIDYPINGNSYPLGENINVQTSYSGSEPDEVIFLIDETEVFTDEDEPFEYIWSTEDLVEGSHTIIINEIIGGVNIASDTALISLYEVNWSGMDLSELGANGETTCTDIVFANDQKGWITMAGVGFGKILSTNDGGISWYEKSNTSVPLTEMKVLSAIEGIYLTNAYKVMYSNDGGSSITELQYEYYGVLRPTFQWKDIFNITTNQGQEILAVGKDTGIPYHFHVYRAEIDSHVPTGDFQIPYPNEYGMPPKIAIHGNRGLLYSIQDEDNPSAAYYMISNDGGVSWEGYEFNNITNSNTYLRDAFFITEEKGWIVGSENGIAITLLTTDGGFSWEKITIPEASAFGSVTFTGPDEGYATLSDYTNEEISRLFETSDGGYTWNEVIPVSSTYSMNKVYFFGSDQGYVCGKGPEAFRYHIAK